LQVLARVRFPDLELLSILGGRRVMIESPLIKQILAENTHERILQFLDARFGSVPLELTTRLRRIRNEKRLTDLVRYAAVCPNLEAFRTRLLS
jgi:hypothetical protein